MLDVTVALQKNRIQGSYWVHKEKCKFLLGQHRTVKSGAHQLPNTEQKHFPPPIFFYRVKICDTVFWEPGHPRIAQLLLKPDISPHRPSHRFPADAEGRARKVSSEVHTRPRIVFLLLYFQLSAGRNVETFIASLRPDRSSCPCPRTEELPACLLSSSASPGTHRTCCGWGGCEAVRPQRLARGAAAH